MRNSNPDHSAALIDIARRRCIRCTAVYTAVKPVLIKVSIISKIISDIFSPILINIPYDIPFLIIKIRYSHIYCLWFETGIIRNSNQDLIIDFGTQTAKPPCLFKSAPRRGHIRHTIKENIRRTGRQKISILIHDNNAIAYLSHHKTYVSTTHQNTERIKVCKISLILRQK